MNYYHVVSRKFCCCLPVRIGVFVLSALGAISGAIGSAAIWYIVVRTAKYGTVESGLSNVDWSNVNVNTTNSLNGVESQLNSVTVNKTQFYIFIVIGVITSIYTLFSVAGFVGAVCRNRAMVAMYSTALWALLMVNLAASIYVTIVDIQRRSTLKDQCAQAAKNSGSGTLANDENSVTSSFCGAASNVSIAVEVIILIIHFLIQLYCCIIVKRYVEQLSEEQSYRSYRGGNKVLNAGDAVGSYYPHQPLAQQHELGPYPYGKGDHSFGVKA